MLNREQVLNYSQRNYERIELMCNELAAYLSNQYDRKIHGTYLGDGSKEYYEQCPVEEQNKVFKNLLNYYSLIIDAVSKGVNLKNPSEALKHSLSWNGFSTYDEIFKTIEPGDVVEMFDLDFRQIWRSNNFFQYSSHSLSALFCKPFQMNFKKEPVLVEQQTVDAITLLLEQKEDWVYKPTISHEIHEIASKESVVLNADLEYVSLLLKEKASTGLISLYRCSKKKNFTVV